jgi:hypothetical protein
MTNGANKTSFRARGRAGWVAATAAVATAAALLSNIQTIREGIENLWRGGHASISVQSARNDRTTYLGIDTAVFEGTLKTFEKLPGRYKYEAGGNAVIMLFDVVVSNTGNRDAEGCKGFLVTEVDAFTGLRVDNEFNDAPDFTSQSASQTRVWLAFYLPSETPTKRGRVYVECDNGTTITPEKDVELQDPQSDEFRKRRMTLSR